jgi:hypothetical protein
VRQFDPDSVDRSPYYDKTRQRISLMQWAELFENQEYSQVAETHIGPYRVSTIWMGLDHGWRQGRPLIFETMVFGPEGGHDIDCRRYSTEADALAGHDETVTLVRATIQSVEDVLGESDD